MIEQTERGEKLTERVLFFDESSMEQLQAYELELLEQCWSIFCGNFGSADRQFIVVGTAYSIPDDYDPSAGRILVFEINRERRPILVAERKVKGAVFSLDQLGEKLVAGIGNKVQLFKWVQREDGTKSIELQKECGHNGHIYALYVKARGDYILVGDLLRSVTLLQYKSIDETLEEVSRDFNTNRMRAIDIIDDDHFLGMEDKGNMFIVRRPRDAATEEERIRLEVRTEVHIGDFVNTIRKGSLNSQPLEQDNSVGVSDGIMEDHKEENPSRNLRSNCHLFGTINGMIGSVIVISEESYKFLSSLERAMKNVVVSVGSFSYDEWRSFHNDRRCGKCNTTIDGDFIEQFLELSETEMEEVVLRLNDDFCGRATETDPSSALSVFKAAESTVTSLPPVITTFTVEDVVRRVEDIARAH